MAKTLDLPYTPDPDTDVQLLENNLREFIIDQIKAYEQQLENLLASI